MENKYIKIKHKECNTIWKVTENALGSLYCPICKTKDGFMRFKLKDDGR